VELFREALETSGLYYVAQIHTCGRWFAHRTHRDTQSQNFNRIDSPHPLSDSFSAYHPPLPGYPIHSGVVTNHLNSLGALVAIAQQKLGATLGNVHGGVDWWSLAQKLDFFRGSAKIEMRLVQHQLLE
jgi:hypothetical protein